MERYAIVTFFHSTCKPCYKQIDAIMANYHQWRDQVDFDVFVICCDDERTQEKAAESIVKRSWNNYFDFFLDNDGEFQKKMNVQAVPHLFVIDKNCNILYEKVGFAEGDEYDILNALIKAKILEGMSRL